ncbi:hypothetical protein Ait01nite_097560 [Actinoplanes italicus]|uniref:Uncharacterized protein n=1 Tax=Actinoplanes italicus TaxID=113567 RepID=A0A2T0JLA4_9ACTN|nr:hypothetical protein [Actinoplanes italicus]PRX08407.1 hypothetical protein CLV67_1406 [Actinoplanes italicus]GIE36711.1 hypothetical protein Ait01nite_097560 [Actinoplanes italicus]
MMLDNRAVIQRRNDTDARRHYRHRFAEGKTTMEAMRARVGVVPRESYPQVSTAR